MSAPVIELRGVSYSYNLGERNATPVFRDLSCRFVAGSVIAITGPSGSGKTTLLDIISGLIQPHSGQVFWGDVDLSTLSERELTKLRGETAGLITQFGNLDPDLVVWDQVQLNAGLLGSKLSHDEIEAALLSVGIGQELHGKRPIQLSGGERQRVALARAMALKPRLLFCDEPTSALDRESKVVVAQSIVDVCRNAGTTAIIVSHDTEVVGVADSHGEMRDGKLMEAA